MPKITSMDEEEMQRLHVLKGWLGGSLSPDILQHLTDTGMHKTPETTFSGREMTPRFGLEEWENQMPAADSVRPKDRLYYKGKAHEGYLEDISMEYQEIEVNGEILEFPVGMPDEEINQHIMQYLQTQGQQGEGPPSASGLDPSAPETAAAPAAMHEGQTPTDNPLTPTIGGLEAAFGGAAQGATLGYMDEMEAALLSGAGYIAGDAQQFLGPEGTPDTVDYREMLEFLRKQNRQAREQNPWAYLAGETVGGLGMGGAGGIAAAGAKTLAKSLARLGGVGAAEGAVAGSGFSEAENAAGVAADAALGAGIGGGAGMAFPGAVGGLSRLGRKLNPFNRRYKAAETLRKDMEQSGVTLEDVEAGLEANPLAITGDMTDQLRERLGQAARKNPKIARAGKDALGQRQEGARERLGDVIGEGLGDTPTYDATVALRNEMEKAAKPLYAEAYSTRVQPSDAMMRILATPAGKSAVRRVQTKFKNKTDVSEQDIPFRTNPRTGKTTPVVTSVRLWDEIQRVLGDDVQSLRSKRPSDARDRKKMQEIVNLNLENVSTPFKSARSLWRSGKEAEDAIELGRNAFKENVPDLERQFQEMSLTGKGMFRLGVFEKIDSILARKGDTDRLANIFQDPTKRKAISMAIADPALEKKFLKSLGDEAEMEATWDKIKGASRLDGTDVYHAGITPQSPEQVVYRGGREAIHRTLNPLRRKEAEHVGNALLGRDPRKLLNRTKNNMGALAGLGGMGGLDPTWAGALLPDANPPLPR